MIVNLTDHSYILPGKEDTEAHIRYRCLKVRKSITMPQVAESQEGENRLKQVAWLDMVDSGTIAIGLSVSNKDGK